MCMCACVHVSVTTTHARTHARTPHLSRPCPFPFRRLAAEGGPGALPHSLAIVTDGGKASREAGNCIVKEAVAAMMAFWGAPFRRVNIIE